LRLNDLSDEEWERVRGIIPNAGAMIRAPEPIIRLTINAILWRMRTGEPWRFMPADYGHPTTIFRRFEKWRAAGVWEDVTKTLVKMRTAGGFVNDRKDFHEPM
jgi:transposase